MEFVEELAKLNFGFPWHKVFVDHADIPNMVILCVILFRSV